MTGWVANGVIGFMWNVAEGGAFPFPYVKITQFQESNRSLIGEPVIWSDVIAWAYPSVGVNARGHIGGTIFAGGGSIVPWCQAWIADDFNGGVLAPLENYNIVQSTDGPLSNVWGDYLRSRPHSTATNTWSATGYSLQGGGANSNARPRYVWFGRERDMPSVPGPIVYQNHVVDDDNSGNSSGNGDGIVNPGETIELFVDLLNNGTATATGVEACLTEDSPFISGFLFNDCSAYGDILASGSATNTDDWEFLVDASAPPGHVINFTLDITATNGGPWTDNFSITVGPVVAIPPDISVSPTSFTFNVPIGGNDSGILTISNVAPAGSQDLNWNISDQEAVLALSDGRTLPVNVKRFRNNTANLNQTTSLNKLQKRLNEELLQSSQLIKSTEITENDNYDKDDFIHKIPQSSFENINRQNFNKYLSAENFTFPATGDIYSVTFFPAWWNAGDYVEGVRTLSSPNVSHIDYIMEIPINSLNGGGHCDFNLTVNGAMVGSFSVVEGEFIKILSFDFPSISGPTYTIRLEETNTVLPGLGSIQIPPDLSIMSFGNVDCTWLSENPTNGTISAGSNQNVDIMVDATGLAAGTYNCNLLVNSNDPVDPTVTVPVVLNVNPAGFLGDVNIDDLCNSTDALIILSYDVGLPIPPDFLARILAGYGDVNDDTFTNSTDALILLSFDVGIPVPFPVCDPFAPGPAVTVSKSSTKNIDN